MKLPHAAHTSTAINGLASDTRSRASTASADGLCITSTADLCLQSMCGVIAVWCRLSNTLTVITVVSSRQRKLNRLSRSWVAHQVLMLLRWSSSTTSTMMARLTTMSLFRCSESKTAVYSKLARFCEQACESLMASNCVLSSLLLVIPGVCLIGAQAQVVLEVCMRCI